MGAAAVRLAAAVGYASAGTVEFLLDDRGTYSFLEMNTRLQVEHPVTEQVYGRDLVADQLRIAAGEPLVIRQADVRPSGHAVEARLYAEDAETGFLPATGRIVDLAWPSGEGIRVESGVEPGSAVSVHYDPLLMKLVARGATRHEALDRMARALDATVVEGVRTTAPFLRRVLDHPDVRRGVVNTQMVEHGAFA
jgi:acetyl/propionyl-CoA carboxylase alpha subunit